MTIDTKSRVPYSRYMNNMIKYGFESKSGQVYECNDRPHAEQIVSLLPDAKLVSITVKAVTMYDRELGEYQGERRVIEPV